MSIPLTMQQRRIRMCLCLAALGLASCSAPGGRADGTPFDLDQESSQRAELTTRVKAALVADERISAASVQVVLADDAADAQVIRLEGFVGDEAERQAALEAARGASEGREVIDAMEIR